MVYPKEYFQSRRESEQAGTCFVVMPFAQGFSPVYDAISSALESAGFNCRRADKIFGGAQVMADVLREIARAQLLVADLTDGNPNVCYELGIAHMTKDAERVLLLAQNSEDIPFDLRAYRCIQYSNSSDGLRELGLRLTAATRKVAGLPYRFMITREDSHSTEPWFAAPDRCLYSFEISDAMIGGGFVKCRVRTKRHAIGRTMEIVEDACCGLSEGESRKMGFLPWLLRLDSTAESQAQFSVVPAESLG